jgi:hypothetical protein
MGGGEAGLFHLLPQLPEATSCTRGCTHHVKASTGPVSIALLMLNVVIGVGCCGCSEGMQHIPGVHILRASTCSVRSLVTRVVC